MDIDYSEEVEDTVKEGMSTEMSEEILTIFQEQGNLDDVTGNMDLVKLRQLQQVLFNEATRVGKEKLGDNFNIGFLRKKIDNTYEHMLRNLCSLSVDVCNRNNCDSYDRDCVTRKIQDQINRILREIIDPTSSEHADHPSEQDLQELEEFLNVF